jgi:D-specific alpha-keto acid dehydrogenase
MPCSERTRTSAPSRVPASPTPPTAQAARLTVYGCEPDEAEAFNASAPSLGIVPTLVGALASDGGVLAASGDRCVSVGHKETLAASTLRALRANGVEHLSTRSIGVDHIDLRAAAALGITVENVAYPPDGVADFTVMVMLMAVRDAMGIVGSAGRRDFRLGRVRGRELCDMTVGVVGVGRIGTAVIDRLGGFGCRVLAHGTSDDRASVDLVSLDEVLGSSDVVTLHVPLTPETFHLLGAEELGAMRSGAFLINTARGALVDTGALVDALERGHLGGAALDVLEGEEAFVYRDCTDQPVEHDMLVRLERLSNVVLTPHTAYYTDRALAAAVEATLAKCLAFERSRIHG